MNRLNYLDSLRGIAICGVILTHVGIATQGLPNHISQFSTFGIRGVQLFFIVSALTLCSVYKENTIDLKSFYTRRFFRIAPMFYICGILYLCLFYFGIMKPEVSIKFIDVILTALFLHGFWIHSINNVVPGGWSIASEAMFYLIFPLVLKYVNDLNRSMAFLAFSFALAVVNLTLGHILSNHFPKQKDLIDSYEHFDFLMNIPSFAMGVFIYHLNKKSSFTWKCPDALFYVVCVMFMALCSDGYSIPFAQLIAIVFLGFFAWCISNKQYSAFTNKPLSYLGEISFSLYLIHFVVLHTAQILLPRLAFPVANLVALYLSVLVISVALATLTYRFIEIPMINFGKRLTTKGAH